jgi:hypothetical protein
MAATWSVSSSAVIASATYQLSGDECTQEQDSVCKQTWVLAINTKPGAAARVCDLNGQFNIATGNLDCRDYTTVQACQGNPTTNFTIAIGHTDLCDNAPDIDATKGLNGVLTPFYDADLTDARNVFQTGDMVYFTLAITDPLSTIDQVTFRSIDVRSSTVPTQHNLLYEVANAGDLPSAATTFYTQADFNVTQEVRGFSVSPGQTQSLAFNFRLNRKALNAISTLSTLTASDMTQQLTIEAVVDLMYHGNTKRSQQQTIRAMLGRPSRAMGGLDTFSAHAQLSLYDTGDNAGDSNEETVVLGESADLFGEFEEGAGVVFTPTLLNVFGVVIMAIMLMM